MTESVEAVATRIQQISMLGISALQNMLVKNSTKDPVKCLQMDITLKNKGKIVLILVDVRIAEIVGALNCANWKSINLTRPRRSAYVTESVQKTTLATV